MSEPEILSLFTDWNDALQTGDPALVTALYENGGILLPTVSNEVRHNHAEIEDYFKMFCAKGPHGVIDRCRTGVGAGNFCWWLEIAARELPNEVVPSALALQAA